MSFADPCCPVIREYLEDACKDAGATYHKGGTYVNIEGPAFSTVAESNLYRSWGCKVVGMTALVEAKLALEAEISYGLVAMATDYDCWREGHDAVTVEAVIAVVKANAALAQKIVMAAIPKIAAHKGPCPRKGALTGAIMTAPERLNQDSVRALQPIIGDYIKPTTEATGCPVNALMLWALGSFGLHMFAKHML